MKKTFFLLIFPFLGFSQTYITHVAVADVQKHRFTKDQTIVIANGKITDIKSGAVKIPAGAAIIEGEGKFLIPGLVDAHVHFFQNGGLYTRPDAIDLRELKPYADEIADAYRLMESQLKRYLKNGITTVIDPGANAHFLQRRDGFKNSAVAPTIYMSGALLTTYEPEVFKNLKDDAPFSLTLTPEQGRLMVQEQIKHHPDFIKIWYIASVDKLEAEVGARKYLPVVQAIIDEAHKNNLKVAVHATERITAQLAVENGCDYLVHSIEDELIDDSLVRLIKKNRVVLCPTLVAHAGYLDTFGQKLDISEHELRQADPFQLGSLLDLKHIKLADTALVNDYRNYARSEKQLAKMRNETSICYQNLKKLSDAGVVIATGTDAGNIGTLHASSYLDELDAMHKAGLDNWEIIEASTIGGAKVLGLEKDFGSIAKGMRADLVLLDANPAENIQNLTKIHRVINKGVVLEPNKILPETPAELIQRQLNAYNFRNLEGFLDTYADNVEIYTFPDKLDYKGKEKMRQVYGDMFAKLPDLHCELSKRIVQGNFVIDKELVQFTDKIIEGTAIYHIENGKIDKVYFVD